MREEEYQTELRKLRRDWKELAILPERPGILQVTNDPTTGILVGQRAPIIAEIINRALRGEYDQR